MGGKNDLRMFSSRGLRNQLIDLRAKKKKKKKKERSRLSTVSHTVREAYKTVVCCFTRAKNEGGKEKEEEEGRSLSSA